MRVAVTGARGRLGQALVGAFQDGPPARSLVPVTWSRPELDLDALTTLSVEALIDRDRPGLVLHAAAWTDVDGCAREPLMAMRRNGTAAGILARACANRGVRFALVSTNEVFDGRRTDGAGYAPTDVPGPINAYGAAKLEAERLTGQVAADHLGASAIIRTSWLHGPPGNDFPFKIAAAALRALATGEPLRVVDDETGCPTYTPDVAEAIAGLIAEDRLVAGPGEPVRVHHLVNAGHATRAHWAREVLRATDVAVEVVEVPSSTWQRASTPPAWAVLEPTPLRPGKSMRPWTEAFAGRVPALRREVEGLIRS